MDNTRVTAMTVTYGKRWKFLSQVVHAVMNDSHIKKLIIVDNGSENREEIEAGVKKYGDKVIILRQEKNLGSAGGFAAGFSYVQKIDCDFVFVLDDDNVPEDGAIAKFLEIRKFFPDEKVVLIGNRLDVNIEQNFFYHPPEKNDASEKLMFRILKSSNFVSRFKNHIFYQNTEGDGACAPFTPIIPMIGFAYGGSFIPIEAVREAPLPDASLVLYGDDSEYSRGISRIGYNIYLCSRPRVHDVDISFCDVEKSNVYIPSTFNPSTPPFKIYFSIRNMVRISLRYTYKTNPALLFRIIIWTVALSVLGFIRSGYTKNYWKRVRLILRAIIDGYNVNAEIPKEAILP